jgi:hypothetical protein
MIDYDDPRIQKLKEYLFKRNLSIGTVKAILYEVAKLFIQDA